MEYKVHCSTCDREFWLRDGNMDPVVDAVPPPEGRRSTTVGLPDVNAPKPPARAGEPAPVKFINVVEGRPCQCVSGLTVVDLRPSAWPVDISFHLIEH